MIQNMQFNFVNLLYMKKNKFTLIDWRQDFAGETEFGDLNYDLAKLLGGIIILPTCRLGSSSNIPSPIQPS